MELFKFKNNGQWEILEKGMGNKQNALGITPEGKGKIKFDPGFGQKEFREYVEERADHMCSTGFLAGEVNDWNWHYDPEYIVEKLIPIKKDAAMWKAWFEAEMFEWVYDHADEKKGHFERWLKNPSVKPIIIVQGTDDKPHQIDGHHRLALAISKDTKTVPVIYGTRKNK